MEGSGRRGKSGGKGRGRGKGRGAQSGGPNICFDFQRGVCTRGDACKVRCAQYSHPPFPPLFPTFFLPPWNYIYYLVLLKDSDM